MEFLVSMCVEKSRAVCRSVPSSASPLNVPETGLGCSLAVEVRAQQPARGVQLDAEPVRDMTLSCGVADCLRELVAERADAIDAPRELVVIDPRQLAHEIVHVDGQHGSRDRAVANVEQLSSVQRGIGAA